MWQRAKHDPSPRCLKFVKQHQTATSRSGSSLSLCHLRHIPGYEARARTGKRLSRWGRGSTYLHHVRHEACLAEPLAGHGHRHIPLQLGRESQRLKLCLLGRQLTLVFHRGLRQISQQVAVLDVVAPGLLVPGELGRGVTGAGRGGRDSRGGQGQRQVTLAGSQSWCIQSTQDSKQVTIVV